MNEWKESMRWDRSLWQGTVSTEAVNVILSSLYLFFWLPFISYGKGYWVFHLWK